jgi:hypothetical protein
MLGKKTLCPENFVKKILYLPPCLPKILGKILTECGTTPPPFFILLTTAQGENMQF